MVCWRKFGFYLPFAITHFLVAYFGVIYVVTYLIPLIQSVDRTRGYVTLGVFAWLLLWLEVSLFQAVRTNPGQVPPNAVLSNHSGKRRALL